MIPAPEVDPFAFDPDDRMHLMKDATRVLYDFVVYDRDGFLGIRILSRWSGPTETGVEYDYPRPPRLENGETPHQCYIRALRGVLPDRVRHYERGPATEICSLSQPHWSTGSRRNFQGDLLAIVLAASDRFKVQLGSNAFMFFVRAGFEELRPKLCLQPSEFFSAHGVKHLTNEVRSWLIEDFMRLEAGLFARNFPVGCSGYPASADHDHYHEPIRFAVITSLEGSGHEMLELGDRYQEIVAASNLQ